ncbi:MAG: nucleotidyltransferase domain-containing protein [bacterium]
MPKFHGLGEPKIGDIEEVVEKIEEKPNIKPRLTFPFSCSKERASAIEQVNADVPDPDAILDMIMSPDIIIGAMGFELIKRVSSMNQRQKDLLSASIKSVALKPDCEYKTTALDALRVMPERAVEIIDELLENCGDGEFIFNFECGKLRTEYIETGTLRRDTFNKKELIGHNASSYLMSTKKPLFATSNPAELIERLSRVEHIADAVSGILSIINFLTRKHKQSFGIIINGSTAKGYMSPESDLDLTIIGNDPATLKTGEAMIRKFAGAKICEAGIKIIDTNNFLGGLDRVRSYRLFSGLYFGDTNLLIRAQADLFSALDEQQWDDLRISMKFYEELNIDRALKRNLKGSGYGDLSDLKKVITLNRVPPPYQETKALIEKRMKRIENNNKN